MNRWCVLLVALCGCGPEDDVELDEAQVEAFEELGEDVDCVCRSEDGDGSPDLGTADEEDVTRGVVLGLSKERGVGEED